jgi:transcriptional regulator with XRE-family HTH domain
MLVGKRLALASSMSYHGQMKHVADHAAAPADTVLTKASLAAAGRLRLSGRHLAEVLGTSEASVSRFQRGRTIDPASKEGELALLFLRLYRSLDALVGGEDTAASAWLWAENTHLSGVPAERIRTVEGLVDAVQYLDGMRGRL